MAYGRYAGTKLHSAPSSRRTRTRPQTAEGAAQREVLLRRVELAVGRGRARPVAGHAERRRRLAAREAAGGRLGDDGGGLRSHDFATCAAATVVKGPCDRQVASGVHPRDPVPSAAKARNYLMWPKELGHEPETCWALSPEYKRTVARLMVKFPRRRGRICLNSCFLLISQHYSGFARHQRLLQQLTRIRHRRRDLDGVPRLQLPFI
jgi:hypothetical protein